MLNKSKNNALNGRLNETQFESDFAALNTTGIERLRPFSNDARKEFKEILDHCNAGKSSITMFLHKKEKSSRFDKFVEAGLIFGRVKEVDGLDAFVGSLDPSIVDRDYSNPVERILLSKLPSYAFEQELRKLTIPQNLALSFELLNTYKECDEKTYQARERYRATGQRMNPDAYHAINLKKKITFNQYMSCAKLLQSRVEAKPQFLTN